MRSIKTILTNTVRSCVVSYKVLTLTLVICYNIEYTRGLAGTIMNSAGQALGTGIGTMITGGIGGLFSGGQGLSGWSVKSSVNPSALSSFGGGASAYKMPSFL